MDTKEKNALQTVFDIVQDFAEQHNLCVNCKVASAINQNEFMIYKPTNGNPIDSSIAYWCVDIQDKLTFSGIKPHAHIWQARMFGHWDGGRYNITTPAGAKKFTRFLEKQLESYQNRHQLKTHLRTKKQSHATR